MNTDYWYFQIMLVRRTSTAVGAPRGRGSNVNVLQQLREYLKETPIIIALYLGWDSPVGMATRYGLDGLGIESRWEARLSTLL